jgi:DNA-binding transcriptional LysR family regulator
VTLNQLRTFIAVVESGSIHRGALALGVSQPAVSAVIRELESTSHGPLLIRSSKGVSVTDRGMVLLQRGRALIADVVRLNNEMARIHSEEAGSISISVSSVMACVFVPPALERFCRQMPNVQVSVTEISGRKAFIQGLRQGEFDFSVTQTPDYFFPLPEDIERVIRADLPLILGCRAGHPLAGATSVVELAQANWVFPADQDPRGDASLTAGFAHFGMALPPNPFRVASLAAALGLYASMDLIGLFAQPVAEATFERYNLVQIKTRETLPSLSTGLFQRAAQTQTTAAACLIECFRACMGTRSGQL